MWDIKNGSSQLTFGSLKMNDSGFYSCKSNGFESEKVHLRVVENLKRKFLKNFKFFCVKEEKIIRERREEREHKYQSVYYEDLHFIETFRASASFLFPLF